MRLTPMDIHHKEFKHAIRGYSEEEVDDFLDEVVSEFERLFKENIDLKEQMEHVRDKMSQYENMEETLRNTLINAQKSAEEVQRNAKRESELIIRDSELKAREVLQDAQMQKQELESQILKLTQAEQEFRSKFKSLLESYLKIIGGQPTEEVEAASAQMVETHASSASLVTDEPETTTEEAAPDRPSGEIPIVEEATKQDVEDTTLRPTYFASEGSTGVAEPHFRKRDENRFDELGDDEDLIYRID
jgi:cell division initiation protein